MSGRDWEYNVLGDPVAAPATRVRWSTVQEAAPSTPASTPSRRTRRNNDVSNWTHYTSFERTEGQVTECYAVGDAIVLANDTPITQRELRSRPPAKGYDTRDARRRVTDELPVGVFTALIIDIFLDEKRELNIKVHWLIRPRILVSGWKGGEMEQLGIVFHEKELLYSSDPAFHRERERALAADHADMSYSSASISSRHKSSKAQDILPSIYIERHLEVGCSATDATAFFVRRRWDPTAGRDGSVESWAPPLDYRATHDRGLSTGQWEHGDADRAKAANERRIAASMTSPLKSRGTRYEDAGSESSSSEESEADDEVFELADDRAASESPDSDNEDDLEADEETKTPTSAKRSRAYEPPPDDDDDDIGFTRPRKVRKISAARQKQRRERLATRAEKTLARRAQAQTLNLPAGVSAAEAASMTPYQRARAMLHVSNTPDVLPCREDEATEIYSFLDSAIDEKAGACLYISGVPGTGKTATVRSVVRDLQEFAADGKINTFRFLELNGMKLTEPYQAFSILWEFISGQKATAKHAVNLLEQHFKKGGNGDDEVCVILVDELDQLLTKRNDVIYNFFNWPSLPRSRLIVIAIANTMDLPERELNSKVISRLGDNRIVFSQYHFQQLVEIISSRLDGLDGVFDRLAVDTAAKMVAKVTGDARRALDICRRTVERIEAECEAKNGTGPASRLVTHADIRETVRAIDQTSTGAFVTRLSLHQKIFLLALSRSARNSPTSDATVSDVMAKHLEFVRHRHLRLTPSHIDLIAILQGLLAMRLVSAEGHGVIDLQRVKLQVRDQDLENWLRSDATIGDWVGF